MINKINVGWNPIGEEPKVYENETYKMRKMQKLAYSALKDSSNVIINAPTASGKTLAICWMIAKRLIENPKMKSIIAVPQTIIADGFRGCFNLEFEETNSIVSWCPRHYLCSDNIPDSNIEYMGRFLDREGQITDINDRVLICSHASLIDGFQKFSELFKNLVVTIDEAHHVSYSEGEEIEGSDGDKGAMVFCNQMGAIVATALKEKKSNIELLLSTATLFRGDRLEIVPEKYMNRFTKFHYPMDEYLKDCHWLKSFSYDFAMYEGSYKSRMAELFHDKIGKTIVYIPHVMSKRYTTGSKEKDWDNVYKAIAGKDAYESKELDNGMTLIKRNDKWIKIVNLVDDSDMSIRNKRKELIIESHKDSNKDMLDVIVALNMFKEGANWKWADREIIVGTKGSLTDMNQIVGRLFRDARDKRQIQTVQMLPFSFDQINKDMFRDDLNEYLKVVFATMLLEEAISPVKIKVPLRGNKKKSKNGLSVAPVNYLVVAVGDENKIYTIEKEIMVKSVEAQDNGEIDFGCNNEKSRAKFSKIVSEVLTEKKVKKYHKEIAEQVYKSWMRESLKDVKGIDLSSVDFDTVKINPLSFLLTYTSGMCGLKTFKKFRGAIKTYNFLPFERAREFVRELNLKNEEEWRTFFKSEKMPNDIPCNPARTYPKEWKGMGDWLGTGTIASRNMIFLSFNEARKFARSLRFSSVKEWQEYCKSGKKPANIPYGPEKIYSKKWRGYGDWLGTGRIADRDKIYRSFEKAREFVRKLNISSQGKWLEYCENGNKPNDIPASPETVYKEEFKGIGDWLGNNRMSSKYNLLSFEKARKFARSLRFSSVKEWREYCKSGEKPNNIPAIPCRYYKGKGWISYGDFLGNNNVAPQKTEYITFQKAREFAQLKKFKNQREWFDFCKTNKKPLDIPAAVPRIYKKEWKGWGDFLGTGFKSSYNLRIA